MRRIYIERRCNRSNWFVAALQIYLSTVLRRSNLRALVLADEDGLVLAGACQDPFLDPEAVASFCPFIVKTGENGHRDAKDILPERNISVLLFMYRGCPLYLAAVGGDENTSRLLLSTIGDVRRILGD